MSAFNSNVTFLGSLLIASALLITAPFAHSEDKAPWVGETLDGAPCKGPRTGFGPHDYLRRARLPAELEVVESVHFTPEIERLEAGSTSTAINDIGYTVMTWPNHHRALHSAMRYRMMFWEWPDDAQVPPAECQLQRAIDFSPGDPVPYMMYGTLLHKAKQYEKALKAYRAALRLRPADVLTQYNMGLTLVELKQYDEAVKMAKAAYTAGIPLPGLKNKLIAAGQWGDKQSAQESEKAEPRVKVTTTKKQEEPTSAEAPAADKKPAPAKKPAPDKPDEKDTE